MGQWIDEVARALASGIPRRAALKRIGGGVAAALAGTMLPAANNTAEAQVAPCQDGRPRCGATSTNPNGGVCCPQDSICVSNRFCRCNTGFSACVTNGVLIRCCPPNTACQGSGANTTCGPVTCPPGSAPCANANNQCCPTGACPNTPFDNCVCPNGGVLCRVGATETTPGAIYCCPNGSTCNLANRTCNCPANTTLCGTPGQNQTCCPQGQICPNGQCVPACPPGNTLCGGTCCPTDANVGGAQCVNNVCTCPGNNDPAAVCNLAGGGRICCPPGSRCNANGQCDCSAGITCGTGGTGTFCCPPDRACGATANSCVCQQGQAACGGTAANPTDCCVSPETCQNGVCCVGVEQACGPNAVCCQGGGATTCGTNSAGTQNVCCRPAGGACNPNEPANCCQGNVCVQTAPGVGTCQPAANPCPAGRTACPSTNPNTPGTVTCCVNGQELCNTPNGTCIPTAPGCTGTATCGNFCCPTSPTGACNLTGGPGGTPICATSCPAGSTRCVDPANANNFRCCPDASQTCNPNNGQCVPTVCPQPCTTSTGLLPGQINNTDAPKGSLHGRTGVPSTCGSNKACAAPVPGNSLYDVWEFENEDTCTQCVTVTLQSFCPVFAAAYSATPDPTNLCNNFLGDSNVDALSAGGSIQFSFNVPAFTRFFILVELDANVGPGVCGQAEGGYNLQVNCAELRTPPPIITPRG